MLEEQNNLCKICGKDKSLFKRRFSVDHCHKTGRNRGLLCLKCNMGLGAYDEDIDTMHKAIEYLRINNDCV